MPLPRFDRLAASRRAEILGVAREHFARHGREAASFNQIIADTGISKTSAYHYFDGKDDLFAAVAGDVATQAIAALSPWIEVSSPEELWSEVSAGCGRMLAHLRAHPDHRAVLAQADRMHTAATMDWIADLLTNARGLGMVAPMRGPDVVLGATAGIIVALDEWAIGEPELDLGVVTDALVQLLRRLWRGESADS